MIMHAKYQCSIINTSEDMSQVKVFVTDRQTEGRTEGRTDEWDLMSPRFRESGGQKARTRRFLVLYVDPTNLEEL